MKTIVALLFGGKSSEHEVSLTSAASVIKEIDKTRFTILPILITRAGRWMLTGDTSFLENSGEFVREKDCPVETMTPVILDYAHSKELVSVIGQKQSWKIDVALPVLHGPGGEDGSIQGLLQIAGIPCVGAGVLGSAVGLDKVVAKILARDQGIAIVPFRAFTRGQWQKQAVEIVGEVTQKFEFPVFVKPANCGSSMGISKANSIDELETAIDNALKFDRKILVEQGLDARELECAVMGNDLPSAALVGEILPVNDFYDYQAKYFAGSKLVIPAKLPTKISEKIRDMALSVYRALDCAGLARVDFLMDKKQRVYFNEINTLPGFTQQSMYPKLWKAAGIPYRDLITRLVELAIERGDSGAI